MTFELGPFQLYRSGSKTLDITLTCLKDYPIGWEYGWDDPLAERKPLVGLRLGKLAIFSFEKFKKGFELRFLGFWWIV